MTISTAGQEDYVTSLLYGWSWTGQSQTGTKNGDRVMKCKEAALLTLLLMLGGANASAESDREIPPGGVPSMHLHYHHYIYDVKCIPDENLYQFDPSGGKYQPEEWRTDAYTRITEKNGDYGIIFNDQIIGKGLLNHTCVLKNGITVNTLIDYDRERTYVAPPPPDGGSTKEIISLGALTSVVITAPNGQIKRYGFLGGGNHHTAGAKRSITVNNFLLEENKKWKIGDTLLEKKSNKKLNELPKEVKQ